MKTYNKLLAILAVGSFLASCDEQEVNFVVDKPESLNEVEALNSWDNLKSYIDRGAYPNFKLGCALGASDYSARGVVYRVANANFDEVSLGNAMKYGSVVGDDGSMNFGTITDFLDATEGTGISVYGHTLAWHAQQNKTYLNSLLADHKVEVGYDDFISDTRYDFANEAELPFDPIGKFEPTLEDGVLVANCQNKNHKFYIVQDAQTEVGTTYETRVYIKGSKKVSLPVRMDGVADLYKIAVTEDWQELTITGVATQSNTCVTIEPANNKVELQIAYVDFGHFPPSLIPLTDQEKYDTLVWEMNRWCNGMMEACAGRVKSWDVINEAISGGGNVNGYYDLQHGSEGDDFHWQDYLGNENYGPVVVNAARKAWADNGGNADEFKLFVNDYNLESDWDNNAKVKALVYWVGVWEKKGCKIDGLSSQMHISYYENKATMASKAAHYVNMLKIMANSGKLVRISELDMGYVDINGNDVATADMTPEMHQNMANYYRYIIQMYLQLVPQAQQYGICQWCLTDAPKDSGWRANTPVGLWTEGWARKQTYVGFAQAFQTMAPNQSENFFDWLNANGLTHYMSEKTAE